jgi:hypothetical protein
MKYEPKDKVELEILSPNNHKCECTSLNGNNGCASTKGICGCNSSSINGGGLPVAAETSRCREPP